MSKILAQGMITLTQLYEGAQVILTPSAVLIPCDSKEAPKPNAYINAFTNVRAFLGTTDITSKITLGTLEYSDNTVRASKTGTKVSITAITTRTGYVDIPVSVAIDGETIDLGKHRFSFVKQIDGQTGQTGAQGAPGFSYTLNIKGGTRGVAYAANGTNPEPKTSSQFSVELLKNGVKIANPASISWTCGGNLSGSSSTATFTPTIKSTYNSESSYVKVSVKEFAASLAVEETIPIVCTKHADGLDWINEWNNKYVQVGTEKIITPKIFAGTKNSANELTGVAIGRDVLGGNANKVIGIVGYKKNTPVFSLDQDANFFVSSSGNAGDVKNGTNNAKGIYFDGNNLYVSGKVKISGGSTIGENNTSVEEVINNSNLGAQANNKIDNLSIGGNNLLRNGNFAYDMANWSIHDMNSGGTAKSVEIRSGGDWIPSGKKALQIKGTNTTDRYGAISSTMKLIPNTKYTISGYCSGHRVNKIQVNVRDVDASMGNIHTININPVQGGNTLDKWYRFETTFTTSQRSDYALNLYSVNCADNGYVWFCDVQIQQGTKATAWTPCSEDVNSNINDVKNSLSNFQTTVNTTFKDGIIEEAEAKAIAQHLKTLDAEKADIDKEYTAIYSNTYLTGTAKTNLSSAKSSYDSAHTSLKSTINTVIADGKVTTSESSSVTSTFNTYNTQLGIYKQRVQEALDNIGSAKINDIQIGGRNLLLNSDNGYLNNLAVYNNTNVVHSNVNGWRKITFTNQLNNEIVHDKWFTPTQLGNHTFSMMCRTDATSITTSVSVFTHENGHRTVPASVENLGNGLYRIVASFSISNLNRIRVVDLHSFRTVGATYVEFRYPMLEVGNKVSAWSQAPEDIDNNITDVRNSLSGFQNTVNTTFKDGIIEQAEAKAIARHIQILDTEKVDVDKEYSIVYNNSALSGTAKTNLASAKTEFDNAHTSLKSTINTAIADGKVTSSEKTSVDNTFSTYNSILGTYRQRIQEALDAISSAKVNNIQIGGRNLALKTSNNYSTAYSNFNGSINICPSLAKVLTDGLKVGDTVTVRLLYKYTNIVAAAGQTAKCWIQGSGNVTSWNNGAFASSPVKNISGSGEYEFKYSFTVTENHTKNEFWSTSIRHDYVQSGSVQWKLLKIEKGNKATDWTPAPEDLENSYTIILTNEAQVIPTDSSRKPTSSVTYSTDIQVYQGSTQRTDYTIGTINSANGITVSKTSSRINFAVSTGTALTADGGYFTIPIAIDGKTFNKTFSWSCSKQGVKGDTGGDAQYVILNGDQVFKYSNNFTGAPTPENIKIQATAYGISNPRYTWEFKRSGETTWNTITSATNNNQNYYTLPHDNSTIFNSSSVKSVTIRCTVNSHSDEITIVKVSDGAKGDTGAAGNGINSIAEYYAVSSSNTTAPTSWSTTVPSMTSTNKYLWNYEVIKYTNNTTKETAKRVIGVYGDKGNTGATGATGNGISKIVNYYLATSSSSGVTTSTSGWTTSVQAVSASKKYLWNYEVITYTNNSTTTSTPCIIGTYGDKGDTGATGPQGSAGKDAYTVILTNESHTFPAENNGSIASDITVATDVLSYKGASSITPTIGTLPTVNGLTLSKTNNRVTIVAKSGTALADSGSFNIPITVDGKSFTKTFSWAKSRKGNTGATGATGAGAKTVDIIASSQVFKSADGGKTFLPDTITLTPTLQNVTFSKWQYSTDGGRSWSNVSNGSNGLTVSGNNLQISKSSNLFTSTNTTAVFKAITNDSAIYDTMTIVKLYDVTELEIGGRNYLQNSNFANGMSNWVIHDMSNNTGTNKSVSTIKGGDWADPNVNTLQIRGTNVTGRYGVISSNMTLVANTTYTISGYCAGHRVGKIQVNVRDRQSSDANIHTVEYNPVSGGNSLSKYYKFETTFTTTSNTLFALNLYAVDLADNGYAWFANVKLEKGNKASDWIPAPEDLDKNISDVKNSLNSFQNTVNTTFKDGIIEQAEAKAIAQHLKTLDAEKADVDKEYSTIYGNSLLGGTAKTNLANAKTSFDSAHNSLKSTINTAISDGKVTSTEKANVDSTFTTYNGALGTYKQRVQEALDAISSAKVDNIQIGGRNLFLKSDIDKYGMGLWINNGGTGSVEGTYIDGTRAIKVVGDTGIMYNSWIKLKRNTTYVYSMMMKASPNTLNILGNKPLHMWLNTTESSNHLEIIQSTSGTVPANTWTKAYVVFKTPNTQDVYYMRPFIYGIGNNNTVYISKVKIEEGTKPTEWTPAPEDIDAEISAVNNKAQDSINKLTELASDSKLTASEKLVVKREWDAIVGEKTKITSEADKFGVSKTDYESKYNTLNSYITPLLSNLTTTSDINGSTFRSNFTNYYNSRQDLLNAITTKVKTLADNAQSTANTANNTANTVNTTVNNNKNNWSNAYERVKQWASGAITGSTNINGGMIATNTITAEKIAIGDFNNYCVLPFNKTAGGPNGGTWQCYYIDKSTLNHSTLSNKLTAVKQGDKFRVTGTLWCATAGQGVSVVCCMRDSSGSLLSSTTATYKVTSASTYESFSLELSVPSIPTNFSYASFKIQLTNEDSPVWVYGLGIHKMASGELIVDGAITAGKINASAVTADKIAANAITASKIAANTITGDKISAGTISADKLKIQSRDSFSVNPNFANWTSTYPYGTSSWVDGGISKVTVDNRYVAQFNVSNASSQQGMRLNDSFFNTGLNLDGMQYIGLEVKYRLTSGTNPAGACMLLDIFYTDGSYDRLNLSLKSINPTVTTNTWYTVKRVFKVSNIQKTFKSVSGYLLANWSSETLTAKIIQFASANAYACTEQDYLTQTWTSGTEINGASIKTGTLSADKITTGTLDANKVNVTNIKAGNIVSGTISADRLDANTIVSKVNGGTTEINGNRIQTGTLSASKITTGTLDASKATITNLNASNITTGTINSDRLNVSTLVSKINSGSTTISGDKIRTGIISSTNGGSYIDLSNGKMALGGTSKFYWDGTNLKIGNDKLVFNGSTLTVKGTITGSTISGSTVTGGTLKSTNGDMLFDMNNGYMLLYNNGTKIAQTNKNSISGTDIYGVSNGAEYGNYASLSAKVRSSAANYQMMITASGCDLSDANLKKGVTLGYTFHSNNWHFKLGSSTELCWRQNNSNHDSFITEGSDGMLRLFGDNGMYLGYRNGDSNTFVIAIRENGSHTYPKSLSIFDDGVRPATDNNGYSLEISAPLNMKGQSINQCSNIKTLGLELIEPIAFNRDGEDKTRTLKVTKSTQNIVEFIGSAVIKNGEAIVDLPNDVSFKNYVVLLTPIGLDRKVSIVEKNDDNFKIVGNDGNVDYVIKFESMDYASYISKSISEDNTDIIVRGEEDKPKEIFIEN